MRAVEILQGLGAASAAFVGGFLAGSVLCAEALWMPIAVKSVLRILLRYCFFTWVLKICMLEAGPKKYKAQMLVAKVCRFSISLRCSCFSVKQVLQLDRSCDTWRNPQHLGSALLKSWGPMEIHGDPGVWGQLEGQAPEDWAIEDIFVGGDGRRIINRSACWAYRLVDENWVKASGFQE